MTVREKPAPPQPRRQQGIQAHNSMALPLSEPAPFVGQSQRADSLADMLRLDRLISNGIHEDFASRRQQASSKLVRERMLRRAKIVLDTTRSHW